MSEILHEVEMSASPADILDALTTDASPGTWWSSESIAMHLVTREPDRCLSFRCTDGPPDWIGTEITFDLSRRGHETVVRLSHRRWHGSSVFLARCTTKWARFLLRLKAFVETPEPDDIRV